MKLHYDDGKVIHLCERSEVHKEIRLVWTKCGIDVPANKSYIPKESERVTCTNCNSESK